MNTVRSDWEISIENYIKKNYPELKVESNDRSVIPSRNARRGKLEIDIFIPELSLGIEANGETYHDKQGYQSDKANGTSYSDEMYKERYCKKVGIELVHVWSSEDIDAIQSNLNTIIQRKLSDPTTKEWHQQRWCGNAISTIWMASLILGGLLILPCGGIMILFLIEIFKKGLIESISDHPGTSLFFTGFVIGFFLLTLASIFDRYEKTKEKNFPL